MTEAGSRDWCALSLKGAIGYCLLSAVTLPFLSRVWIGELPPFAILQLPKTLPATWLRHAIVRHVMGPLGVSSGAPSPDYAAARPYALAIVYCVPLVVALGWTLWRRPRSARHRRLMLLLFVVAVADYALSLRYLEHRGYLLY